MWIRTDFKEQTPCSEAEVKTEVLDYDVGVQHSIFESLECRFHETRWEGWRQLSGICTFAGRMLIEKLEIVGLSLRWRPL